MTDTSMIDTSTWSAWQRFWHQPVRAERLALTRILLAFFLLLEQFIQYLPHFAMFYGPAGVAPSGVHDEWLLETWKWTILFFNTDDLAILLPFFWIKIGVIVLYLVGWHTRIMNVALWFMTMCWINRNPALRNGADDVLMVGLFLLMFGQTGHAFSVDAWLRRRKLPPDQANLPVFTPAWPVRIIQIQITMLYLTTGLAKLMRVVWDGDGWFQGTWWDGSSLHYVFCDTTMGRWSFAQFPLPFWLTAAMTYASVWWETLFPLGVLWRRTRALTLWFGVLFHIGIFMTIEIGWFSFYTTSLYAVWVPDTFWGSLDLSKKSETSGIIRPLGGSYYQGDPRMQWPGKSRKLEELVLAHYSSLYRFAYRLSGSAQEAEDLTQDTFCQAQAKWGQLRDQERARSWLFTILRNAYLHRVRGAKKATAVSLEDVGDIPDRLPDPLPDFDPRQLQEALDDLPEPYRSPIILFYFEEFSYRDIADQMNVPIGTIMSRLARAKTFLKTRLLQPAASALASGNEEDA